MSDLTDGTEYIEHRVEHYRQRFNWDCGVSCVLMLLSEDQRQSLLDNFHEICDEEGFRQSTWTIDLCYLLKRFNLSHCMYTTLLGVNEEHIKQGYYNRIISVDESRVRRRFDEAPAAGLHVSEARVALHEIVAHLAHHGPVVALVDAAQLVCDLCKGSRLRAEIRRCFGGGYAGHYILLVGANARRRKVLYRDPGARAPLCAVSCARLERARRARGTDEDLIFVYKDFR